MKNLLGFLFGILLIASCARAMSAEQPTHAAIANQLIEDQIVAATAAIVRLESCPGKLKAWIWLSKDAKEMHETPIQGARDPLAVILAKRAAAAGAKQYVIILNPVCVK